ncbi:MULTISPECIES: hypothetical protein [Streptomyces]|uniref:hypothetical protein n=1 Tax=Streptomyces sp. SYP-A7185 TaxID=3040076 RepID=UPI0038F7973E
MKEASVPKPHAELAAAYWLDSPVLEQHGLCTCPLEGDLPVARPAVTFRYLMIGAACGVIVVALAMALAA